MNRVLITGGAGFIGSHLADLLLSRSWEVRALDSLDPQVHGPGASRPDYLSGDVELVVGDVRDPETVAGALEGCGHVVHFAAAVGVGQSMYEMSRYTSVNCVGAATLLEAVAARRGDISGMLVASSMSIYGEGLYGCARCGRAEPGVRPRERLVARLWEPVCPSCGGECSPMPTPETKTLRPTSVYAVNKRSQEELFLSVGEAYGIPAAAMRFFNVYGTRQALSNPYTGVAAIFASSLLNDRPPLVFEDGLQSRDFTHVSDIAEACLLALESGSSGVFNVGTGSPSSVLDVARALARGLGRDVVPRITGEFRAGDIRHCYADVAAARERLGFEAKVRLEDGMAELASWLAGRRAVDAADHAAAELRRRGLAR